MAQVQGRGPQHRMPELLAPQRRPPALDDPGRPAGDNLAEVLDRGRGAFAATQRRGIRDLPPPGIRGQAEEGAEIGQRPVGGTVGEGVVQNRVDVGGEREPLVLERGEQGERGWGVLAGGPAGDDRRGQHPQELAAYLGGHDATTETAPMLSSS